MALFSGMDKFGLKDIKEDEIFVDQEQKKADDRAEEVKKKEAEELDFLIDRTYECPVCGQEFKSRTVKSRSVRLIGSDMDLRPKYQQLDCIKYDVVVCPRCGYAALGRTFKNVYDSQKKAIIANISQGFHYEEPAGVYSYDDAIERYQIAFANAMVTKQIDSEKAYLCLKMAWCIRGKMETLDKNDPKYKETVEECKKDENEALKLAMDGFVAARSKEQGPYAGMDQSTLDYLIAVLSARFGKLDVASKLIASLMSSMTTNPRIKDRARELKEQITQKMKS